MDVYVEGVKEPLVLDEDGHLDLTALQLDPATILLNGKLSLVDKQGRTKREWGKLVELLEQTAQSAAAIGSADNPLIVSGKSLVGTMEDYEVSQLSATEFKFDSAVPPIQVLPSDQERAGLQSLSWEKLLKGDYIKVGSKQTILTHDYVNFLQGFQSGTSEDSMHGRDDSLLRIISTLGGYGLQQNRVSEGTTIGSRVDAHVGQPPAAVLEEKERARDLPVAKNEVLEKVAWIPHYDALPFLVGIAIAGREAQFFTFNSQSIQQTTPVFDLTKVEDCARCLRAAINTGRYLQYVKANHLLHDVTIPFNKANNDGRRSLTITWLKVDKVYLKMTVTERKNLKAFYGETKDVPYLEKAISMKTKAKKLYLELQPVGLQRRPENAEEAKVAVRCILLCLQGCHQLKWALNDLRWANVILTGGKDWVVIDAELARRFGQMVPPMKKRPPASETTCSHATDLYMVHELLRDLPTYAMDDDLRELMLQLENRKLRMATNARTLLESVPWLKAMKTPSPQGVKSGGASMEAATLSPGKQGHVAKVSLGPKVAGQATREQRRPKRKRTTSSAAAAGAQASDAEATEQAQVQPAPRQRKKPKQAAAAGAQASGAGGTEQAQEQPAPRQRKKPKQAAAAGAQASDAGATEQAQVQPGPRQRKKRNKE